MTHTTKSRPNSSLGSLRKGLEEAERQFVQLDESNVSDFLVGLDRVELMFAEYGRGVDTLIAEQGRWERLRKRIRANPKSVIAAAENAGGLPSLRAHHVPATGPWWHLDSEISSRRILRLKRAGIAIGAGIVAVLLWWGITTFFPPAATLNDRVTSSKQLVTAPEQPEAQGIG